MSNVSSVVNLAEPFPKVEFEDMGLGTLRTSGTYIALMLQLETPESRASILAWTAKRMGIKLSDLIAAYNED